MTGTFDYRLLFILASLLILGACNPLTVKEETAKPDLIELEKEADAAYLAGDMETSERHYQVLVAELPEIAEHWFRLANVYVRTNRPVAAINLYREAVLRQPDYAKAWFNLSIVQLKQTAYSLTEMLRYVDVDDPLHKRAYEMLEGIQSVIERE